MLLQTHRIMHLFEQEGTPAEGVPSAAISTFRNISFAIWMIQNWLILLYYLKSCEGYTQIWTHFSSLFLEHYRPREFHCHLQWTQDDGGTNIKSIYALLINSSTRPRYRAATFCSGILWCLINFFFFFSPFYAILGSILQILNAFSAWRL